MTKPVLIIVGMGPGVSLATARRFASEGFAIGMIARSADRLQKHTQLLASEGVEVASAVADAADLASLAAAIKTLTDELGAATALLYNAMGVTPSAPSTLTASDLAHDMTVNMTAPMVAAQTLLPTMKEVGKGTLLFTGGSLATKPMAQIASLSIGKAGIRLLALMFHEELEGTGIQVGTVTIDGAVDSTPTLAATKIADAFWSLHEGSASGPEIIVA